MGFVLLLQYLCHFSKIITTSNSKCSPWPGWAWGSTNSNTTRNYYSLWGSHAIPLILGWLGMMIGIIPGILLVPSNLTVDSSVLPCPPGSDGTPSSTIPGRSSPGNFPSIPAFRFLPFPLAGLPPALFLLPSLIPSCSPCSFPPAPLAYSPPLPSLIPSRSPHSFPPRFPRSFPPVFLPGFLPALFPSRVYYPLIH